jgi:hypothetical protein
VNKADFTSFWCLMAYDTNGRQTYAYGDGAEPFKPDFNCYSAHGGLSHRPREARKFASREEAEAALPGLLPWIEKYLSDDRRRSSKDALILAAPLRPYFEQEMLCVYPDGSGLAREFVRDGMDYLAQQEAHCATARAFVQKHLEKLAGMSWRIWLAHEMPEFQIGGHGMNAYRGKYCPAARIAALWPVQWRRKKEEHPHPGCLVFHWTAQLDGCRLTIASAESHRIAPPDDGLDGTLVKAESEVAA